MRFFAVAALLIKAKQQHEKNHHKNTGLFINCIDFVVVRTRIKKNRHFFRMLEPWQTALNPYLIGLYMTSE
jgi:hypothetical protein